MTSFLTSEITSQGSIANLESKSYDTLLKDRPVTFKAIDSSATPEWSNFVLNDNVHITSMKEVGIRLGF